MESAVRFEMLGYDCLVIPDRALYLTAHFVIDNAHMWYQYCLN